MKTAVIAELGINHNGDWDTLIELATTALESGADYIKLQTRTPEACVPRDQWDKPKQWKGKTIRYIDYKHQTELTQDQLSVFNAIFGDRWFTSVWDVPAAERILEFEPEIIKIPSAKITDLELLAYLDNNFGGTIIASTGMSDHGHVFEMVNALGNTYQSHRLVLMACNSSYPCDDKDVNLSAINTLSMGYPLASVGFSSHSKSPYPAIYSAVIGAKWIEVHFTLDRTMEGSDHAASLEKSGLQLLTREVARIPVLMGNGKIEITESEVEPMKKLRGNK